MIHVSEKLKAIGRISKVTGPGVAMKPSRSDDELDIPQVPLESTGSSENLGLRKGSLQSISGALSPSKKPPLNGFPHTSLGRLYTKDLDTVFSMLMISLDLTPEGAKTGFLSKAYPFSFTIEDAILKIQNMSIRIPSGSTRTTFTCQVNALSATLFLERFMSAKMIHCPSDRTRAEPKPGIFLQPTAKGVYFIDRYCQKNGIQVEKMPAMALLLSNHNSMQCFTFDRDPVTDSILKNDAFLYLLFQRLMGPAPNVYSASKDPDRIPVSNGIRYCLLNQTSTQSIESPYAHRYFTNPQSDALSQYYISSKGVRLFQDKQFSKTLLVDYCFTGRAMCQWLLDCTDLVYKSEAFQLVNLFLTLKVIEPISESSEPDATPLVALDKNAFYQLTDTGKYLVSWPEYAAQPATPLLARFPHKTFETPSIDRLPEEFSFEEFVSPTDASARRPSKLSADPGKDVVQDCTSMSVKPIPKPILVHTSPIGSPRSSKSPTRVKLRRQPQSPNARSRFPDPPKLKMTLREILEDAAMSWLFSQYLEDNLCQENLLFYKDLSKFLVEFEKLSLLQDKAAKMGTSTGTSTAQDPAVSRQNAAALQRYNTQIQLYARACKNSIYVMYNQFLAPSAPCELNIDSKSRKMLVEIITMHLRGPKHSSGTYPGTASGTTSGISSGPESVEPQELSEGELYSFSMENLKKVSLHLEQIKMHIYRTMENDSLPKFLNSDLYASGMKSISVMHKQKKMEQVRKQHRIAQEEDTAAGPDHP